MAVPQIPTKYAGAGDGKMKCGATLGKPAARHRRSVPCEPILPSKNASGRRSTRTAPSPHIAPNLGHVGSGRPARLMVTGASRSPLERFVGLTFGPMNVSAVPSLPADNLTIFVVSDTVSGHHTWNPLRLGRMCGVGAIISAIKITAHAVMPISKSTRNVPVRGGGGADNATVNAPPRIENVANYARSLGGA